MTSPANIWAPVRTPAPPEPEPQGWWPYFEAHRDLSMPAQVYDWTCSICATTWVLQATGIAPDQAREATAAEIGYPSCVDQYLGLKDTNCLVRVFADHGLDSHIEWVDWDRAYEICSTTTGVLNSTNWYHFVGIRGVAGPNLWVANSAQGYQGIWETISRTKFDSWAGTWKVVVLDR